MLNNKKNKKQHQGETTMNTFTNNGEFVRPLGYRSHEEVRKDMTVLISESDVHGQVLYLEQLLDTAGRGNKRAQRNEIIMAMFDLIRLKAWAWKYNGQRDMEFMSTYLPQADAACALGVSLHYYRNNIL
tara:strand:+ start:146 stop:532 length:387 start_codon:yes stop_codon:yes gene_type:complete